MKNLLFKNLSMINYKILNIIKNKNNKLIFFIIEYKF